MYVLRNWCHRIALALLMGLGAATAHADESTIDAVLLLDVSREMDRKGAFEPARKLLLDLVPRVVRPGAQVAYMAFGEGVHTPLVLRVPLDAGGVSRSRALLRTAIEKARPVDQHRFLYTALERAVQQLSNFQGRRPTHDRRIVVVSYGSRRVPDFESNEPIARRLTRHDGPGMAVGRDWTLWYGYFGKGDEALRRFVADRGAGSALSLQGGKKTRWKTVRVDTAFVELGAGNYTGQWKRKVRVAVSGARGTVIAARAGASGSRATLTVMPAQVELRDGQEEVRMQISGYARNPGGYAGAWLRFDAAGKSPTWVIGSRVAVLVGASGASVAFADPRFELGRVDRGSTVTREFDLVANAEARRRKSELAFEVADVPPDVGLKVTPAVVRMDEHTKVRVELTVHGGAKPGNYESRIVLRPRGGMRVRRREMVVRYRVGRGAVTILEQSLVAPPLVAGSDVVTRLTLRPDIGAVEAGARVEVILAELPEGLEIELLRRFRLVGETVLEIRLHADSSMAPGTRSTELRFAASGDIRISPTVIPLEFEVVKAPPVGFVLEHDMGVVYQTQAERIATSVPINVPRVHHGTLIELEPISRNIGIVPKGIRLREGAQTLNLNIRTSATTPGESSAAFRVSSVRAGVRRSEGKVIFRWTVRESFLRVIDWRPPAPLPAGDTLISGTLVIESSPDLKGRLLDLKASFGSLSPGTQIAAVVDSIQLTGERQRIKIPVDIVHADAGTYPSVLELELGDAVVNTRGVRPLRFDIVVEPTLFAAQLLDPERRNKLLILGGALVLLFFMFAVLFKLMRKRARPVVEFHLPEVKMARHLNDSQQLELRDVMSDDSF